jgi:hypothetical protein
MKFSEIQGLAALAPPGRAERRDAQFSNIFG